MTTKTKTMVFSIMVPVNPNIPAHVQRWMRDNLADHIRQEWTSFDKGKPQDSTVVTLARQK